MINIGRCDKKMEIIGHRGASFIAPENTLSSVNLAWMMGSDGVEVDVHLSKDNKLVVIHDGSTTRTAGIDLKVEESSSEELRKLDVGIYKGAEFTGRKIPFLEEVIVTIPSGKKLFVEIKSHREILPILKKIIDASGKKSQIVIIGFDLETMGKSKKLMPDIPTYWLRGSVEDEKTKKYLPHDPQWINLAKGENLDGLNVHFAGLTEGFSRQVKESGLKLYVWTVNDIDEAKRLQKLGVDGMTSDKPDFIINHLCK